MTFALPVYDSTAIRCHAIIDRLVHCRPGTTKHANGLEQGAEWLQKGQGVRHWHPSIGLEGDAVIRALVEDPTNPTWLVQGEAWLEASERARKAQGYHRPQVISLPDRTKPELVAANT